MTRYALIGLGNMGGGMAAVLAKAGHQVQAFDLSPAAVGRAADAGAEPAASAADAVAGADVVLTMLPAGAHVRQVYDQAVLPHAGRDALLIDCSTVDVDTARDVATLAREAGFAVADAPVSGGVTAAAAGTLTFMVGCPEPLFPNVKAALSPMAKTVARAGEAGAGQAAKICNNLLLGVSMIGVCEALALAERLELDPERFFEIASASSGQCWSLTSYCPWPGPVAAAPSNRGYEGGFAVAMMLKDLKLAQGAAASVGASTPLAAQAEALYALFDRLGYGEKDFSSLLQLLRGRLDTLA
ncbi:3-hydroxyisobutyrate dehydrogenase [Phenylobacterium sp.]|uniref:3-hydroxyisobutyrate dehydrogenase n=1 Tax=Phenylobacterium sp. TaxID=1871053 RepID=UPI00273026D6|nr:3-hydroxyisobutyrate dehydrogenase [Phenylobacterium sp.]MDP2213660.1 3-hydroxyisobutyrate dehydrogenase [Phenylobacterium sp.]